MRCTSKVYVEPVGPALSATPKKSKTRRRCGRTDDVFGVCKVGQAASGRLRHSATDPEIIVYRLEKVPRPTSLHAAKRKVVPRRCVRQGKVYNCSMKVPNQLQ
jgi:hypothetical protein